MQTNQIFQGDALTKLKELESESVNCCMTSPPYWALRDYGVSGQLGLEPTFQEYINKLCDIFDEVKRVLRKDGTLWVNIGDTYGGSGTGQKDTGKHGYSPENMATMKNKPSSKLESKTLCNIPARFSIEMQNRGWILRNVIIWHKPNCMPSSVKDRFTVDFEYLYFFVKSKKYFFETQYEKVKSETINRNKYGEKGRGDGIYAVGGTRNAGSFATKINKYKNIEMETKHRQGLNSQRGDNLIEKRKLPEPELLIAFLKLWKKDKTYKQLDELLDKDGDCASHWFTEPDKEHGFSYPSKEDWVKLKEILNFDDVFDKQMTEIYLEPDEVKSSEFGRNKRCVWKITTKPFKEAHFATYPETLCETPIKAGCPINGIVLDPFFGAGTTGLVALKQGKKFIGIELNPEYIKIAEKRLKPYIEQSKITP